MKKVPGATKFPRAGKSFQTPVVKVKKKTHTLGKSKTTSMVKLLIVLFVLSACARVSAQTTASGGKVAGNTQAQDSLARLNAFVKEFNDTATIERFQVWLFKNATGEQNQNFSSVFTPYFNAYISQRYDAFLKSKTQATKPKQ